MVGSTLYNHTGPTKPVQQHQRMPYARRFLLITETLVAVSEKRPLTVHARREAILLVASVEKHITKNCVPLRRMCEVFVHRQDA